MARVDWKCSVLTIDCPAAGAAAAAAAAALLLGGAPWRGSALTSLALQIECEFSSSPDPEVLSMIGIIGAPMLPALGSLAVPTLICVCFI